MVATRWETWTKGGPAPILCAKIMLLFSPKLFPLVEECRGRQSSPTCLQCWRMRQSGRSQTSFTPNTSWMQTGSLWNQRPSCLSQQVNLRGGSSCKSEAQQEGWSAPAMWFNVLFHGLFLLPLLQVAVPAWGNSWPRWSSLFSLPLSCRNSPLCSLRTSPGHGRMVALPSRAPHTRTWCELSQDKCALLSFHSQTTTNANSVREVAVLGRIMLGSTQGLSSLCRCPQLCKVRIWPNIQFSFIPVLYLESDSRSKLQMTIKFASTYLPNQPALLYLGLSSVAAAVHWAHSYWKNY